MDVEVAVAREGGVSTFNWATAIDCAVAVGVNTGAGAEGVIVQAWLLLPSTMTIGSCSNSAVITSVCWGIGAGGILRGGIGVDEGDCAACGTGVIVAKTASESDDVTATMTAVGWGRFEKLLKRRKASVPKMIKFRRSKYPKKAIFCHGFHFDI